MNEQIAQQRSDISRKSSIYLSKEECMWRTANGRRGFVLYKNIKLYSMTNEILQSLPSKQEESHCLYIFCLNLFKAWTTPETSQST